MNRLIINADDFGISKEVNEAIVESFQRGYIDRTTIIVNMEGFLDACEMARTYGLMDRIGLHINVVEGKPLTNKILNTSLCKEGLFSQNALFEKQGFILNDIEKVALAEEIEAQISLFLEAGFSLRHLDSHRHSHCRLSVLPIVLKLAKKYGFPSVRLSRNIPFSEIKGIKRIYKKCINYCIQRRCSNNQVKYFGSLIDVNKILDIELTGGVELMVHPIFVNGQIKDAVLPINFDTWMYENKCKFKRVELE